MTRQGCLLTPPPKQILKNRNTTATGTRSRPIIRQVTGGGRERGEEFPEGAFGDAGWSASRKPGDQPGTAQAPTEGGDGYRPPEGGLRPTPTPAAGKKNMFAKMLTNMGRRARAPSGADRRRARAGLNRNSRAAERLKTRLQRVRTRAKTQTESKRKRKQRAQGKALRSKPLRTAVR